MGSVSRRPTSHHVPARPDGTRDDDQRRLLEPGRQDSIRAHGGHRTAARDSFAETPAPYIIAACAKKSDGGFGGIG